MRGSERASELGSYCELGSLFNTAESVSVRDALRTLSADMTLKNG